MCKSKLQVGSQYSRLRVRPSFQVDKMLIPILFVITWSRNQHASGPSLFSKTSPEKNLEPDPADLVYHLLGTTKFLVVAQGAAYTSNKMTEALKAHRV